MGWRASGALCLPPTPAGCLCPCRPDPCVRFHGFHPGGLPQPPVATTATQALLESGASPNDPDSAGLTALSVAEQAQDPELLALLGMYGAAKAPAAEAPAAEPGPALMGPAGGP